MRPDRWEHVVARLNVLGRSELLRPSVAAMKGVVARLREDPRLSDVSAHLFHVAVILRERDATRRVAVWVAHPREPGRLEVSWVDPPFELSDAVGVSESEVLETVVRYLRLSRPQSGSSQR